MCVKRPRRPLKPWLVLSDHPSDPGTSSKMPIAMRWPIILTCAAACLAWTSLRHVSARWYAGSAALQSLERSYAELHARTLRASSSGTWPDAAARDLLARGLQLGVGGAPEPVRFPTDGPLQVAAFLQCATCGPDAVELIVQARRLVFAPFVEELVAALPRTARPRLRAGTFWPETGALFSSCYSLGPSPSYRTFHPPSDSPGNHRPRRRRPPYGGDRLLGAPIAPLRRRS